MTTISSSSASHTPRVICVVCQQKVSLQEVTAGSLYADERQAFACSIHLADRVRWITIWAVFDYQQRQLKEIAELAENLA
jgi:hypothetical protein